MARRKEKTEQEIEKLADDIVKNTESKLIREQENAEPLPRQEWPKFKGKRTLYLDKENPIDCCLWEWNEYCLLPFPMPACGRKLQLKYAGNPYKLCKYYCGFDIETTNIIESDSKLAFMYHWQFIFSSDNTAHLFTGRTWAAFLKLVEELEKFYNLSEDKRIIVWVANLGFEFSFIRRYFDFNNEDFFARELRHPMKARTGGFEFHEALTISGGSLEQLAKDYTTTQKLKGDLDYSIRRNSKTPLTPEEKEYCYNDVLILAEWSKYIFDNYIIPDSRIPLTKTGILRSECRLAAEDQLGTGGMIKYRQLIKEAFPDEKQYETWFRWLFRGGYVHSNVLMTGFVIEDADGDDITSSYPARMDLEDGYPLTPFKEVEFKEEYLETKCCIIHVKFYDIRRHWSHSIESKSKCLFLAGSKKTPIVIDNGRVAQAAEMEVYINEVDYSIYKRFYDWERMEVLECWTAEKGQLPLFLRKTLNKHYMTKADLKKRGLDETTEYTIAKQKVNSFYGMMVTRIELDKITYDDEWRIEEKGLDFQEEIKSQFLLPQWGIWVTSFARASLLSVVADITEAIGDGTGENGAGVIYCDTDSIKFYDPENKVQPIIDRYNKMIADALKKHRLTHAAFFDLGMYDHEKGYPVKRFKTLGAKRYLIEDNAGHVKATIAGLPKQSILKLDGDPFDAFDLDGMELEAEAEIKNTIHYNDEPTCANVEGELMYEESSAAIYNIGFTMNLDKIYHSLVVNRIEERVRKYGD